jgi:hypothetical protein
MAISKDLSVFYDFIKAAKLELTFQSRGPVTLFLPLLTMLLSNYLPAGELIH